jgi:REP element-mobilizing transposase RayT
MARQLRIEYEGAFYHVISRGARKDKIFFNATDKLKFLGKLGEAVDKFNLKIHSYVLMDNHYHLLKETPEGNLSKAMHYINTSYSNWFKSKHQTIGSVFQGRYKSILVEKEAYFLALSAYIHLNPVRAAIVDKPEKYGWSSFNDFFRIKKSIPWLFSSDILNMFSGNRKAYKTFVHYFMIKGNEIQKEDIIGKYGILGSEEFRDQTVKKFHPNPEAKKSDQREKPDLRHLTRLDKENIKNIIVKIFQVKEKDLLSKKRGNIYRKVFLYGLKKYTDLSLREIGEMMDMDYAAVSQMVKRFIADLEKKENLRVIVTKFDEEVKNCKKGNVKC